MFTFYYPDNYTIANSNVRTIDATAFSGINSPVLTDYLIVGVIRACSVLWICKFFEDKTEIYKSA